jgi:peptidoglycan/LPS O-acetylase OafA/YrhL
MRRDIQALRGFSILVVLLYHSQFGLFRGGFLGVDIFFVISGFVITSKLMEGEGSFGKQIKEFYIRRAKRILPASLLVTFLTALLALFFLPAISREKYSIDALASALFSANLNFARLGNDYLAQSTAPSPFLHYWSLGVEEQFYLLWPIFFLLGYRRRKYLLAPTLFLTAAGAIWYTSVNPVTSFYLPFTRFWEFFAGILLAMNPDIKFPQKARIPLGVFGWIVITFAVFYVKTNDATPGVKTIIPIVGTMIVLAARMDVGPQFLLPWLGDFSFSLYLVHWPIVVYFLDRNLTLSSLTKCEIILVALLLSYVLTTGIERPLRFQKKIRISLPQWGVILALASTLSFGVLAVGANATGSIKLDKSVPITYKDGCHLSFNQTWPTHDCVYGDLQSKKEVVLAGDSHAAQWFPALEKIALKKNWKLTNLTKSSCPATTLETIRNGKFDSSCAIWQQKVLNLIAAHKPALVVISNFSEYQYPLRDSTLPYSQAWVSGEMKFINSIFSSTSKATRIIYIQDTPKPTSQVKDFALSRSVATDEIRKSLTSVSSLWSIDPTPWLCPKKCLINFDGYNTYRDATHISVATSLNLSQKLEAALPL